MTQAAWRVPPERPVGCPGARPWARRHAYELLVHLGELDARGTWITWGAWSCASWLAEACDIDLATARTHVRVARDLRTSC